jgi:hypothetical protein
MARRGGVEHGAFENRFVRRWVLGGDGDGKADAEPFPAEAENDDDDGRSEEQRADDDAGNGAAT